MNNESIIECYHEAEKIGYLYYVKIPLVFYCIVYNFYITPTYRNKGYGTQLLAYTCDYLKSYGASKVYIQPGPFEPEGLKRASSDYDIKLQRLVALYKKNQFVLANKMLQSLAFLGYKCIGIDENYRYLMVRILT